MQIKIVAIHSGYIKCLAFRRRRCNYSAEIAVLVKVDTSKNLLIDA